MHSLICLSSDLKMQKQDINLNNILSIFQIQQLGVLQESTLGPVVFSTFLKNLFLLISKSELHNFADVNIIFVLANNIKELIKTLKEKKAKWLCTGLKQTR